MQYNFQIDDHRRQRKEGSCEDIQFLHYPRHIIVTTYHRMLVESNRQELVLRARYSMNVTLVTPRRMVDVLGRCRDPWFLFSDGLLLFVYYYSRGRFVSPFPSSVRIRWLSSCVDTPDIDENAVDGIELFATWGFCFHSINRAIW